MNRRIGNLRFVEYWNGSDPTINVVYHYNDSVTGEIRLFLTDAQDMVYELTRIIAEAKRKERTV